MTTSRVPVVRRSSPKIKDPQSGSRPDKARGRGALGSTVGFPWGTLVSDTAPQ
jgi:hypothetical protein